MNSHTKQLYFFIAFILVSASVFAIYFFVLKSDTNNFDEANTLSETASNFEKAEYYFLSENYSLPLARRYYEASIAEDPRAHPHQWYQLARINFLEGDFDTSLHNLDMQVEYFDDAVPSVHYIYGLVYGFRADALSRDTDYISAEKHFLKYIEYEPESPWPRIDLSWIYFSQREFANMITTLEPIYEMEQENPWYLNMYGLALLNTGEEERAVGHFKTAVELSSSLRPIDWAKVYPGNNPANYQAGLEEFLLAVQLNLALAEKKVAESGDKPVNNI